MALSRFELTQGLMMVRSCRSVIFFVAWVAVERRPRLVCQKDRALRRQTGLCSIKEIEPVPGAALGCGKGAPLCISVRDIA